MHKIILAQTDTTVGFLSQDANALAKIKARPTGKPFLKVYADLKTFKASGGRVPKAHRSRLRRSKKSTFVIKNLAVRIVTDTAHRNLLKPYGWLYSTSANRRGHTFERSFCEASSDIIVEDFRGLHENPPSSIMKLGKTKRRRLR